MLANLCFLASSSLREFMGLVAGGMMTASAQAGADDTLTLVRDAQPCGAILVVPKVGISERFAVEELQSLVEQISGAKSPIGEPSQTPPGGKSTTWIVVGKAILRGALWQ